MELLDVTTTTSLRGLEAAPELDSLLAEHGWQRRFGWGDGPHGSLVAWLTAAEAEV
jgi:hypothetical protein